MDEIQKSRIRLSHWIDHNKEHLRGYVQVAQILEQEGLAVAAGTLKEGIALIEDANEKFRAVEALLPGHEGEKDKGEPAAHAHDSDHGAGHHHSHDHDHHHGG
ncbi:MAG: hypothetical protein P8182_12085 [Deltaproteobacteria bacterium]